MLLVLTWPLTHRYQLLTNKMRNLKQIVGAAVLALSVEAEMPHCAGELSVVQPHSGANSQVKLLRTGIASLYGETVWVFDITYDKGWGSEFFRLDGKYTVKKNGVTTIVDRPNLRSGPITQMLTFEDYFMVNKCPSDSGVVRVEFTYTFLDVTGQIQDTCGASALAL